METLLELQAILAACENSSSADAASKGSGSGVAKAAALWKLGKRKPTKPQPESLVVYMLVLWQHILAKVMSHDNDRI